MTIFLVEYTYLCVGNASKNCDKEEELHGDGDKMNLKVDLRLGRYFSIAVARRTNLGGKVCDIYTYLGQQI